MTEKKLTRHFELGTFVGYNFRDQKVISPNLSAQEVINWDHDANGEAEFFPSGDNPGVLILFKNEEKVTGPELLMLDKLLSEVGDDSKGVFLALYSLTQIFLMTLDKISPEILMDCAEPYAGEKEWDMKRWLIDPPAWLPK